MAGRILIADDVATNRIVMKVNLAEAYYEVLQASGGLEAVAMARTEIPDLILLDLLMPDMDGVAVCEILKNDPITANIPIIMVTAKDDSSAKINALRAGADDFMTKPLDQQTLLARVRSLLRARDTKEELRLRDNTHRELGFAEETSDYTPPATVALISMSPEIALQWKSALAGLLPDKIIVLPKEQALSLSETEKAPDVFVITCDMKKPGEGLRLLSELRSRPNTRHSAVLMIIPQEAQDKSATALDLGANDLIFEDVDPLELSLRLQAQIKRKQQADRLRETVRDGLRMAVIDPLTGLYNRRYADSHLLRIAERATETNRPFAVMVLDLDRFKQINDSYGHNVGDEVLKEVATRIKDNLRGVDMVARIGGEEFLVVMPDAQLAQVRRAADRLCGVVSDLPVTADGTDIQVSVSIGVAMGGLCDDAQNVMQLIELADRALYASKSDGRNQVTFSRSAA